MSSDSIKAMRRRMKAKRQSAFPEALPGDRGGEWDVEQGSGTTSLVDKRMTIPYGETKKQRATRLHEMMHARFSPHDGSAASGANQHILQGVEDMRMWTEVEHHFGDEEPLAATRTSDPDTGVPRDTPLFKGDIDRFIERNQQTPVKDADLHRIAGYATAMNNLSAVDHQYGFNRFNELCDAMEQEDDSGEAKFLREAYNIGNAMARRRWKTAQRRLGLRGFDVTADVSRYLTGLVDELAKLREQYREAKEAAKENGEPGDVDPMDDDELQEAMEEAQTDFGNDPGGGGVPEWGDMAMDNVPLPRTFPGHWKTRKMVSCDEGVIPRNMHRMCSDGRIFRRISRSKNSPTVLIDVSGSMSLSDDDVKRIVKAFPFATVALYAGSGGNGKLRVVVNNNRAAKESDITSHIGGGNFVDGPALRWLAKQRGPRVWFSDGLVTGRTGGTNPALARECLTICKLARIQRAKDIEDALHALAGRTVVPVDGIVPSARIRSLSGFHT